MTNTKRILVAGDVMLDSYYFGSANRISPEAPVPVLLGIGETKFVPGGAANVAINLVATGIATDILSVVGTDSNGKRLITLLEDNGIKTDYILKCSDRPTTNKLRYIGQNNQQLLRVDDEVITDVPYQLIENILKELENSIKEYGLILISDYMKGFLTERITQRLIQMGNTHNIPVLIDVKDCNWNKYYNATLLKPNRKELQAITGMRVNSIEEVREAAIALCKKANCSYVLTTLGSDGMLLVDAEQEIMQAKSEAKEVYDVTGAGDTSIAYLAVALLQSKSLQDAVSIANFAAGIQVSKVGTSIVYPYEVEQAMQESGCYFNGKQLDAYVTNGLKRIEREKEKGKRIIFTNGCFDILHAGHITYLKEAKQLGDVLVVALNSDASVKRLKGKSRPINNLSDRSLLISALEMVDYIVTFEEDTPIRLIEEIKPDVLVKGGDYKMDDIVGADFVRQNGGRVVTIPFVSGKSTTNIIQKMQEQ